MGSFPVPDARDEDSWEELFESLSDNIKETQIGSMFKMGMEERKIIWYPRDTYGFYP